MCAGTVAKLGGSVNFFLEFFEHNLSAPLYGGREGDSQSGCHHLPSGEMGRWNEGMEGFYGHLPLKCGEEVETPPLNRTAPACREGPTGQPVPLPMSWICTRTTARWMGWSPADGAGRTSPQGERGRRTAPLDNVSSVAAFVAFSSWCREHDMRRTRQRTT